MIDYAKMRRSMVDGQLRTNGLTSAALIEQFLTVPRENFLTGDLKKSAYVDDDIPLPHGGFLLEPLVLSRLLTAAALKRGERVLNIGDPTGYTATLLIGLGAQVTNGSGTSPATFDLVLLNGAVAVVPETLLALLNNGGRLVTVVQPPKARTGAITVVERDGAGVYSHDRREDAAVPYLAGYAPVPEFQF